MYDYRRRITRQTIDEKRAAIASFSRVMHVPKGWISTIRYALGMSQEALGNRAGMPKQMISRLEQREVSGEIRLKQLQELANALGCELVYAFLPREPLEVTVARRAKKKAESEIACVEIHMALEGQSTPLNEERIDDYIIRHIREKDIW